MAGENTGGITLRVTPEQLKSKAGEVSSKIKTMEIAFDELARYVSRTSQYWIGEAGDKCRSLYEEDKKEVEEMLKRLKEHPKDLLVMAHVYEDVERRVEEISNALPEDVIS